MALRAPTVSVTRLCVTLRFPDPAASATVRDQGGARVAIGFGDGAPTPGVVVARTGSTLEIESTPGPDTAQPVPGDPVVVSWTELNDLASVRAEVELVGPDRVNVTCSWPPVREQRRAFRRFPVALPVWLVRTGPDATSVVSATTHDLSGGGVSIDLPNTDLVTGERLVLMLRCDGTDLVLPAAVHSVRPEQSVVGFRFTHISQSDQDLLVRIVTLAEAARGR